MGHVFLHREWWVPGMCWKLLVYKRLKYKVDAGNGGIWITWWQKGLSSVGIVWQLRHGPKASSDVVLVYLVELLPWLALVNSMGWMASCVIHKLNNIWLGSTKFNWAPFFSTRNIYNSVTTMGYLYQYQFKLLVSTFVQNCGSLTISTITAVFLFLILILVQNSTLSCINVVTLAQHTSTRGSTGLFHMVDLQFHCIFIHS